jgi:hypothetical protein
LRSDTVPRRESGPLLAENLCHPFWEGQLPRGTGGTA